MSTAFCGGDECSYEDGKSCNSDIMAILDPNSCTNHILVTSVNFLFHSILIFVFIYQFCSKKIISSPQSQPVSSLSTCSAIFNGSLSIGYFLLGIWTVREMSRVQRTILPLHGWLVVFSQGLTWLLLSLAVSIKKQLVFQRVQLYPVFTFLLAGFLSMTSMREAIVAKALSIKMVLDVLSFPGAALLLLAVKRQKHAENGGYIDQNAFYLPLEGEEANLRSSSEDNVTPFAKAGYLRIILFSWLNPLMKKGKEKALKDEDIPCLRLEDRAETCYCQFTEQLSKQKQKNPSASPSILLTIFLCQRKALLISGFFALIKLLTLSTGPVFLYLFIQVAQGKEAFKYEGYALTGGLFLAKCLESLSERQWFFKSRLIGLQVKSLLTAAIYQKQLRLANIAKTTHSPGEILNYVTVDTHKIGEYPYWFHQIWTTGLQICIALVIIYYLVGMATIAALLIVVLTTLGNSPVAKLQQTFLTKLMVAQDSRLKAITEGLTNMKVLKLYAWETHFKNVIEGLRAEESNWLSAVQLQKGYYLVLFWSTPIIVSTFTFWACYLLGIPLNSSNVFTFLATLRIVQEPIRSIPDVLGAFIEAKVSLSRIVKFLEAPELQKGRIKEECQGKEVSWSLHINATKISWEDNPANSTLTNINLQVKPGEKVALCGEVGAGKSTLLAAILGEVPYITGSVQVHGKIAYVSQTAWIQTGTIKENILFGSQEDQSRYHEVLEKCCLVKDLEMLPFGDQTVIGERGVNLSGGQKQRVQLARALYQDADVYLLDDPFSAVDAHTAKKLFKDYVMGALSEKAVILVTHQVDFLPAFDSILLMSEGEILEAATYNQLLNYSREFQNLVHANSNSVGLGRHVDFSFQKRSIASKEDIHKIHNNEWSGTPAGDQLIKDEERETGNTGLKPYIQYLGQSKGFLYLFLAVLSHLMYIVGQLVQNLLLAADLQNSSMSRLKLILIYSVIGCGMSLSLLLRSYVIVVLGLRTSHSIFSKILSSLFRAPMSFYDSTPIGRILSRVSSDLGIVDLELSMKFSQALSTIMTTYFSLGILAILTWPILIIIVPTLYSTILLQVKSNIDHKNYMMFLHHFPMWTEAYKYRATKRFYFSSAKELMRIVGTNKSSVASHLAESIAGATIIRAFEEEERFFSENFQIINKHASAFFHSFSANEWLIQRLEILCAIVLSSSVLAMTLLPLNASDSGYVGMALSYGLSLNVFLVFSAQNQCMLENSIVSVERLEQYMHIPSEASETIEGNRPNCSWPGIGKVEIRDLKVRYRPSAPLVLKGISCTLEGGHKVGIVGRTGSGKTTLISALFRLVEPTEGSITIDGLDISTIGIHDLRSQLGIIPQDPTLFSGSVRYNLDPLSKHTDHDIWEVLEKCQLREVVEKKDEGLNSLVEQDGTNWSMGQRQLFCLGRALLKRRKILVLDEATASIDNATDSIIQKTIRTEFADCTVITVAHRIPTVMDCNTVLAISDGRLVECDEPKKLMSNEASLFGRLVKEYWSHCGEATGHEEDL